MQTGNSSITNNPPDVDWLSSTNGNIFSDVSTSKLGSGNTWIRNLDILSQQLDSNSTNSTKIMEEEYNWIAIVLTPLIFFGLAGNILVCMAIAMEKRLQSVTNYFLLSLAVTDLLLCLIVMPFSIVNEFTGRWLFGPIVCNLYVTADVLMCTSSILHLCTISLERYMAIRSPLTTRNKSKSIVILKVVLVWIASIAISSPITILGFIEEKNVFYNDQCALNNPDFKIYGSICAFFIPLFIMVLSYGLTLYTLIGQSNKCQSNGISKGQPVIRRSRSRKAKKTERTRVRFDARKTQNYPLEPTDSIYTPMITRRPRLQTNVTYSIHGCNSGLSVSHHRQNLSNSHDMMQNDGTLTCTPEMLAKNLDKIAEQPRSNSATWPRSNSIIPNRRNDDTRNLRGLVKKHQLVIKAANILLMRRDVIKRDDDVHTEQKASKVIGMVFIIFVVCWAPFFIVNIMTVLCDRCEFQPILITAFVWLGYVSSTLNPIIYTMFNKTFKMTFKKLLLCRYNTLQRNKRIRSWLLGNGSLHQKSSSCNSLEPETPC